MKNSISRRSAVAATLGASAAAALAAAGTASAHPESVVRRYRPESQTQHNKGVAVAFLDLASNRKQPQAAADRYVGTQFIQHNPLSADGTKAFVKYVKWATTQSPELNFDFKRVFGENRERQHHVLNRDDSTGTGSMPLKGEYEPSTMKLVRDQVVLYESSAGSEGTTLGSLIGWDDATRPDLPVVILTTLGAKSGKICKSSLMWVEHDGSYAVVASAGGVSEHPVWYHNLAADPRVDLQEGPVRHYC